MTWATFQANVWEDDLLEVLDDQLVFKQLFNRNYEGKAKKNASVRINTIGDITTFAVVRNQDIPAAERLTFTDQELKITQARGFNFGVDNIDKQQAAGPFMNEAKQRAAFALAVDCDTFLSALLQTEAGGSVTGDTIGIGAGEASIYDICVEMGVELDEVNCPDDGRWVVLPPFAVGLLRLDDRFVSFGTDANRAILRGAPIGMVDNLKIYRSNRVPRDGTEYSLLAGHNMAATFADAIDTIIPYEPEGRIGEDALKGEHVYGATTLRPELVIRCDVERGQLRAA